MNEAVGSNGSLSKDERTWGMLCHLIAFAGIVIPYLGCIIGPLVIWLIKKDEMPFVNDQGKESLNFQITMFIAFIICFLLMFVFIGIFLMLILGIYWVVVVIIAAVKANDGVYYRYPYAIRFLK